MDNVIATLLVAIGVVLLIFAVVYAWDTVQELMGYRRERQEMMDDYNEERRHQIQMAKDTGSEYDGVQY